MFLDYFIRTASFPVYFPKTSVIVILKLMLFYLIIHITLLLQNFVRTNNSNYVETEDKIVSLEY